MRAEIKVNEDKLNKTGYTMNQLLRAFQRYFGKGGLDCILDENNMFIVESDADGAFAKIIVRLIRLIEFDWFYEIAERCYFYYWGVEEDILGQANKIRSPERLRRYYKK